MIDAVYADDLAFLANIPALAESVQHSLEQAAGSINLNKNVNKTEFIYFKPEGAISSLNGKPLKLVD